MRGVAVDGQRFRQIRRARGLTQVELALAAGVAERTVRNAELGRPVRLDFLHYLATAMGVDPPDLALDPDELRVAKRQARSVTHILGALEAMVREGDLCEFDGLVTPDVLINVPGPAEIGFTGQFRG